MAGKDRGSLVLGPTSWEGGESEGKATLLPPLEQALDSRDLRREQGTGSGPGSHNPNELRQRRNSEKLPT